MSRPRCALVLLAACATVAVPAAARTVTIPRDGRWSGIEPDFEHPKEIMSFKVRSRAVRDVQFSVPLHCTNSDDGSEFNTVFRGGKASAPVPEGRRIPQSGVLRLHWMEEDAFRKANVHVEITFATRRPAMTVNFTTHGEIEDCEAFSVVRLRHSAH
jgi:hypothetical protein